MINPELCVTEDVFVSVAKSAGVKKVYISALEDEAVFIASVKIKTTNNRFYLATRRNPNEPRKFKRVDVAISALGALLGVKNFFVRIK